VLLPVAAAGLYGAYDYKFRSQRHTTATALTGGAPNRAPALLIRYGCGGCHTIPGVPGARGLVGPPLADLGKRVFVGGVVSNTPDILIRWIVNLRDLSPRTAMPITGISGDEARDVAAYLYALP
jgi:mono/diheme cytochrome c family protein